LTALAGRGYRSRNAMRIILVRHGETEENRAGIIQGHLPGTLSACGREQIALLGIRLAGVPLDAAYSSDLARARETAEAIVRHHPGLSLMLTEELRERNLGPYQGANGNDVDWGAFAHDPGVEDDAQLLDRARRLLERVRREYQGRTVLLCGHGAINRAIFAAVVGCTITEDRRNRVMDNTGVTVFEDAGGGLRPVTLNDTRHLTPQHALLVSPTGGAGGRTSGPG
jgi:broad specificity phosphatase PhoE